MYVTYKTMYYGSKLIDKIEGNVLHIWEERITLTDKFLNGDYCLTTEEPSTEWTITEKIRFAAEQEIVKIALELDLTVEDAVRACAGVVDRIKAFEDAAVCKIFSKPIIQKITFKQYDEFLKN